MIDLCRTKCLQKIGMQKLTHFLAEVTFLRVPITQLIAVFFGQIEIGTRVALTYYIHQLVVGMKSTRHPFNQRLFVGIIDNDANRFGYCRKNFSVTGLILLLHANRLHI